MQYSQMPIGILSGSIENQRFSGTDSNTDTNININIDEEIYQINGTWLDHDQSIPIDTSSFLSSTYSLLPCCFWEDLIMTSILNFFSLPFTNRIMDMNMDKMWKRLCYLLLPVAIMLDIFFLVILILILTIHQILLIVLNVITCGLPLLLYILGENDCSLFDNISARYDDAYDKINDDTNYNESKKQLLSV